VIVSNNLVNSNLVSNTVSTPVVNNSYVLVRYPQVSYNLMVAQLDRIEGELMYVHRGIKQRNNSFKFESEAISLSNNSLIGGVVLTKKETSFISKCQSNSTLETVLLTPFPFNCWCLVGLMK